MEFNKPAPLKMTGNMTQNFKFFKQQVEIYMTATETDGKSKEIQVARLLNLMGTEALKVYNTLAPEKEKDKEISAILNRMEKYCSPRTNEIMAHYKFFTAKQNDDSFDVYLTRLKELIKPCNFGVLEDKLLKTQIILGIQCRDTLERLLREDMTLEKVVSFCQSVEAAEINCKELGKSAEVHHIVNKKFSSSKSKATINSCTRCGNTHSINACPAYGKVCNKFKRLNHFSSLCKSKFDTVPKINKNNKSNFKKENKNFFKQNLINTVDSETELNDDDDLIFSINQVKLSETDYKKWFQIIYVNNVQINFQLDTGAETNVLPYKWYKIINTKEPIQQTKTKIESYGGYKLSTIGTVVLKCKIKGFVKNVQFIIIDHPNCVPILGLNTCISLNLVQRINQLNVNKSSKLDKFICTNKEVFEGLGTFPDIVKIKIIDGVVPKANPPRRVPLAIKTRLEQTLKTLTNKQIIEPVNEPVEWVNNIVIVEKSNKTLRVCIDPSELNKYIVREFYPIPTLEEIIPKLTNKNIFCVFDLKDGFHQLKLDKKSSDYCTFSSPFGCYKFLRAPFGLASIPEIFQKLTNKYFGDIDNVTVYFDDILCATNTIEEMDTTVKEVVARAKKYNIKFNSNKVQFYQNEVKYLGLLFSKEGMRPDNDRITAIKELGIPKNKKELQQILGTINYLRKFIPNLSEISSPYRELLKKNVIWQWTDKNTELLNKIKNLISEASILNNFDINKPIVLQCDSSQNALGCCLLQDSKPVAFASRSLTSTESNYAQIEKELLSVTFSLSKFHNYIYGSKIIVKNDHLPLVSLMKKPIDKIKNNRLRRLRIKTLPYTFNLEYVPGPKLFIADLLSRNIVHRPVNDDSELTEIVHTVQVAPELIISGEKLKLFQKETQDDEILSRVIKYYKEGWPKNVNKNINGEIKHYCNNKVDITVQDSLVYFNNKLIIPKNLRKTILKLLHETHLSAQKQKSLVKSIFYWPGINSDILGLVESCNICQKFKRNQIKQTLINHEIPKLPFIKIGLDIAEFRGLNYLVVVDYYSRWLEIIKIKQKDTMTIISKLKPLFSKFGIPMEVIADNMPCGSVEFQRFAKEWEFEVKTSSPHYPRSNGLAEKGVDIAKKMIQKSNEDNQDLELYLLNYRNSKVAKLDYTPAQL
ncbi:unnamed protein product [Macrosiphum euphorbiae]|uniref:RNA-directed DNA polymerase n=1 Tax=Macrosiphum euphorbiae TaxID=13131 RepID=A0AAV0XR68_9HEMI|nr:unnamed protein product [Macrosiphum euphorbiae]